MNRRKFLQRAAVGSAALGSFAMLGGSTLAADGRKKNYHFVVASTDGGSERLILSGDGTFDSDDVDGGGSFDHFRTVPPLPFPVIATGTWKAKRLVSFTLATTHLASNPEGRHGVYQAGVLDLTADFHPVGMEPIKNVPIEVVCNLGPAGASTPGKDEGVYVTFPGPHKFEPTTPTTGVTIFSTDHEPHD